MSSLLIGLIIGGILAITLVLGIPVAFALGLTALISVALFLTVAELSYFTELLFSSLNSFAMLSIPLFVLMGSVFGQSKAGADLLEAANSWVGRLRGGLAMASVMACSIFAALTGSSAATAAALGRIAIPEMLRRGYPAGVACGAIVAGGTLGILIPPSVTLILYGIATEQSIGQLFLGGLGPGVLVTVLFCAWISIAMRLSGRTAPRAVSGDDVASAIAEAGEASVRRRLAMLLKVAPFVLLLVGILFVLYAGIATPSEAAALGALLSVVLVGALYRSVTVRRLLDAALETARTSTMILMIVAFSAVLGQIMSYLGIPQDLAQGVAGMELNRWVLFLVINLLFLVLGFFIPPVAIILITMPVLFPLITQSGFDPIWFGVVMTLNMEMALITPPVGLNLYVVQGIAPDVPLREVLRGSFPYVGVLALGILLLIVFPPIVTWLPQQTFGPGG